MCQHRITSMAIVSGLLQHWQDGQGFRRRCFWLWWPQVGVAALHCPLNRIWQQSVMQQHCAQQVVCPQPWLSSQAHC